MLEVVEEDKIDNKREEDAADASKREKVVEAASSKHADAALCGTDS